MKYQTILTIVLALIFWASFTVIILQVPYPQTITQASLTQILFFFVPLLLAGTLTLKFFLKNLFLAGIISLGLIFSLILQALNSLNIVTISLIITSVALLISYFRKSKKRNTLTGSVFKNLTNRAKIPKLTKLQKGI